MKKKIILFLLISCLFSNIHGEGRTKIAVLDFILGEGVSPKVGLQLSDYLRTILCSDRFLIVTRENMLDIFKERGFQESECSETECLAKAGKLLGVEKIIVGTLGKVGTTYLITIKLLDINTGRYDFVGNEKAEGGEEKLIECMDYIGEKICGGKEEKIERKAKLGITTNPNGAKIYFDNEMKGVSPLEISDIEKGEHILKAEKEGYEKYEKKVNLSKEENSIVIYLEKIITESKKEPVKIDFISILTWTGAVGAAITGVGFWYAGNQAFNAADDNYSNYKSAGIPSDAEMYRNLTESFIDEGNKYMIASYISGGVAVVLTGIGIYRAINKKESNKKVWFKLQGNTFYLCLSF